MAPQQQISENIDPRFRVEIDWNGSSSSPEKGIWLGQHVCVSENFSLDDAAPQEPGAAVCRHQLGSEHSAHYSVLRFAYLVLHCGGFPHSVMCQLTRHQDSAHLVQSGRYTGKRFLDLVDGSLATEDVFYFRSPGIYQDRSGNRYEYTEGDLAADKAASYKTAIEYAGKLRRGWAEEHARDCLRYNFRQNFAIAGDLQAVFHWLDQRSKKDSQLEIQGLAHLATSKVIEFAPALGNWYKDNRYGRARLAP